MTLSALLESSHRILEANKIAHALIGGMALASLGIHRATNDVDYLIHLEDKDKTIEAFQKAGWKCDLSTVHVLHFSGNGQVDFLLASKPISKEILETAKAVQPHQIRCVSPEGFIAFKIQAYKNDSDRELQDKADIAQIIRKYPGLDWAKVKLYADLFKEWDFIASLRSRK